MSNDTIMKPPYDLSPEIIQLTSSISEQLGEIKAYNLGHQSVQLRKENQIKTIHSSLQIEGNTLSVEQITKILEKKRVIGPKKDILEVQNAIHVYENLKKFDCFSPKSFLSAHEMLMKDLIENPGKYRTKSVGIVKGNEVQHLAPPFEKVPHLMNDLFDYLLKDEDIILLKSCVFHYEMEFIHPFMDGNGRMGRLWQTLILMQKYPVFQYIPFETLIRDSQKEYYNALAESDNAGKSTIFIKYMLTIIHQSLANLLQTNQQILNDEDRLKHFIDIGNNHFSRKEYMLVFKTISSATASRDLKKGLELKLIRAEGKGNRTKYYFQ